MTTAEQIDLFAPSQIPGLRYAPDFLSRAEETELIERIATAPLLPFRFQRWTGKRLTHSYGWSYDFERGRFEAADPLPRWLLSARDRAADFAGLSPDTLVQALLIRYDPGAGIGWHKDRPVFADVIGLSLGAAAPMRFRRRNEQGFARRSVSLEPRSIYHLAGEVRHEWEHSIAEQEEARWSITFRSLKPGR